MHFFKSIDIFVSLKGRVSLKRRAAVRAGKTMNDLQPVVWFVQLFIFLFGVAIGHSFIQFRIRREENRKKELELALLEKREELMPESTRAASDLEDALYKARVRQEIDDILSKS